MDLHRLMVFFHVAAIVGLFGALVIEGVALRALRYATSYEQAREWAGLWSLLFPIGVPSVVVVLASGVYLATTLGLWEFGWAEVSVPSLVIVAVAGGIVGPRRNRLRATFAAKHGPLPRSVQIEIRHPLLLASWRLRAALLTGVVFEMTTKLDSGSVLLMTAVGLIAISWSLPAWRTAYARA